MRLLLLAALVALATCLPCKDDDKRVWTFGVGRSAVPHEFFDEETGQVRGFGLDIVREACEVAGKKCEFIGYKDYNLCWNGETDFAEGLSARYFDACVNWYKTPARDMTYAHSTPYASEPESFLYARPGSNIRKEDLMSPHSYKVAFRSSFYQDPSCLRRHMLDLSKPENVMVMDNFPDMIDMVNNGQADLAFFSPDDVPARINNLARVGGGIKCSLGGIGVMARKDSAALLAWLNPAISNVVESDGYQRTCYIAKKAYGGDPVCFSPNDEL